MTEVTILDKKFKESMSEENIQNRVIQLANEINNDFAGKDVVFVVILNGAFMFASDLYKNIDIDSKISFVKLASYQGTNTTGVVKQLIGLNEPIKGKTVIVVEDIVDTGNTLDSILKQLNGFEPLEIKLVSLLFKEEAYEYRYAIDYVGFKIPNEFIVGYGLDYDGYGRNLKSIYKITN